MLRSLQVAEIPVGLWDELQQSELAGLEGLQCGEAESLSQAQSPIAWDHGAPCRVSTVVGSRDYLLTHREGETESRGVSAVAHCVWRSQEGRGSSLAGAE